MDDAPRPSSSRLNPVKVYGGTPKAAPRKRASPVLAGILVGIPAAAVWALVAYVTGYEIGWVAWAVGAAVGFAVAKSAHEPSASLGPTAAALAVGALILGKVLILEFAVPPILRTELLKNHDATAALFVIDMGAHQSFSPELQGALEQASAHRESVSSEQRDELQERMATEATARAAGATSAERERVVGVYSARVLAEMGFFGALKRLFSLWDVVWIALAISSAFRIAQRANG